MEKIEADKNGIAVQVCAVFLLPLLIIIHLLYPDSSAYGICIGCPWWHRLTFHFFHAGLWHMLLNWWFFVTASFAVRYKVVDAFVLLLLSSLYPMPGADSIIGLSAMIYAMVGMASVYFRNSRYVIGAMLLTILLTGLIPHVALGIHLWSYLCGLGYGYLKKTYGGKISQGHIKGKRKQA